MKEKLSEKLVKKHHKMPFVSDLKDLLYKSAERYQNRLAFKLKDENGNIYGVTYGQFQEEVISLGTYLLASGLASQRIAVIGKNSYSWAVSYYAASIVGIVVPIDKELHIDDVTNFINVSETKCVLGDEKYISLIHNNPDKLNHSDLLLINFDATENKEFYQAFSQVVKEGKEKWKKGDNSFGDITINPEELHILLFTSGTTGTAKGVCLSHQNVCANIMSTYGIVKVKRNDQVLSILPIHHTYECTLGFLLVLYSGGCIAYCDGLKYINKNIEEYSPSLILCVPLLLEKMYKKIETTVAKALPEKYTKKENFIDNLPFVIKTVVKRKVRNTLGGRLRAFIVGAAPLNPNLVTSFLTLGMRALQGYGLTECSPLVAGNNDFYMKPDAVGLPIPNVEYKIKDPNEEGIGEILVKGPNVMLGYYNDEEATKKVLKDGWFYTGDLGKIDEDGWLYVTGRLKTVIVTKNGKNIYPEEIEHYLNKNPLISEALVSGIQTDKDDETYVNAQILPNVDAIKEYLKVSVPKKEEIVAIMKDIVSEVNEKLPNYKHIKSFKVREEEFEKTTTQKIKRYGKNMNK